MKLSFKIKYNPIIICLSLYALFFFISSLSFSQKPISKIDSIKVSISKIKNTEEKCNLLNQLALKYNESNLDSALHFSHLALKHSTKTNNKKILADTYYSLGVTYKNRNVADSANFYLFNSVKLYEQINDLENVIKTNIAIGEYYRSTYILNKSILFIKKAIALSKTNEIFKFLPSAYNRLGAIYFELSVNNSVLDSYYIDTVYKAIFYIDSSIYWSNKFKIYNHNVSNKNILGACYKNLKKFDISNKHLFEALIEAKRNNELIEMPMIYRNLCLNFYKLEQYKKAIEYGTVGAKMADSLKLHTSLWLNYFALYDNYRMMEDFRKAMRYLAQADSLQLVVFNENFTAKTQEFDAKYKTKENELLIEHQTSELEKNQQKFLFTLVGFFLTILILCAGVIFTIRIRKINKLLEIKNNEIEKLIHFKHDLTSMIVHDLKNPLNTIINFSKMNTQFEVEISEKMKESNNNIENAAFNMLNLVNNIMDIQKFEEAKINLKYSENVILNTIDSALQSVSLLQMQKNIRVQKNINGYILAEYDNDLIERILINLLTNALKFSPNNGIILIDAEIINNFIKIKISDEGPGIPSDKIPFLFNKFARAEIREIGLSTSSGLGLAFSKLAIKAHGGEIGVISEFGKGSCFWFTIISNSNQIIETKKYDNSINISLGFSPKFLQDIKPLKIILSDYKFYQTSKIIDVVDNYKCENIEFSQWKVQIKNAVLNSNSEKFIELISS